MHIKKQDADKKRYYIYRGTLQFIVNMFISRVKFSFKVINLNIFHKSYTKVKQYFIFL